MVFALIDVDYEWELHFYVPHEAKPIVKPLNIYDDMHAPMLFIILGLLRRDFELSIISNKSITLKYTPEQLRKALGLPKKQFDNVIKQALETTDSDEQDIDRKVKEKLVSEAIKAGIDKGDIFPHADAVFYSGNTAVGYTVLSDIGKWSLEWERLEDMSSVMIRSNKAGDYEVIVYAYYLASSNMKAVMHWGGDTSLFIRFYKPKQRLSKRV